MGERTMEFEHSVPLICIHAISLVLNGALFGTLVRKALFRCPSNRFVLSLTVSHLLVSLLTIGVSLTALIHVSMHDLMEEINLYLTFGSGLVNSLTLTTISCERYITIARPMRYKSIVTAFRCSLIVVSLWTISAVVTLVPLLILNTSPATGKFMDCSYFSIVFTCVTVLCLATMCVCYYIIFTIAKEKCQHVQIGQFTASISSDWPSSAYPSQAEGQSHHHHQQKSSSLLQHVLKANARHINSVRVMKLERVRTRQGQSNSPRKTIATIMALVGSLLVTQLPVSLTLIRREFWNAARITLALSAVTNPILYGFLNRKIRIHLWRKTLRLGGKPKRPECCKNQSQSGVYSDILKEISQAQVQELKNRTEICGSPPQGIRGEEDEGMAGTLPENMQFPRKDSQDSGADMTFSDEEEEHNAEGARRVSEPTVRVFTICRKDSGNDDQYDDDGDDAHDQPPQDQKHTSSHY